MENESEERVTIFFALLQLLMVIAMDILISGALANTTLSNTNALIAGIATAVVSLLLVVVIIADMRQKVAKPPPSAL